MKRIPTKDVIAQTMRELLQFYMRGLGVTLQIFNSAGTATKKDLLRQDKTVFLPQQLYDALTAVLVNENPEQE